MDGIASDFALQIKSLREDLQTQSILLKKLQEEKRETLRNKCGVKVIPLNCIVHPYCT